jgi:hypothetical protein
MDTVRRARPDARETHIDDLDREAATARLRAAAQRRRRPRRIDVIADASSIGHADRSTLRFARHYAEVIGVMFIGMFALMAPTGWLLGAFGTSWSRLSPAMNVFTMALTMTVPMVAWMRYRGHALRPNIEMAASMLIPTFAVIGLLWGGIGTSGSLMRGADAVLQGGRQHRNKEITRP